MKRDLLRLEYVPLSQVILWDRNPKLHDIGGLVESIKRHGFKDPLKFEPALNSGAGGIVEGNGRGEALAAMRREKPNEPPRGIDVVKDTGEWAVPVLFGVDADSEAAAEAYGVDHNNLTLLGADGVTPWDLARMWDDEAYSGLLTELAEMDALPVSVDEEDLDALLANLDFIETASEPSQNEARQTLAERFIIPPFSVLDARQGYWQERKRAWIALGIQSELGRGELLTWVGEGREISEMDETSRKILAACRKASPEGSLRDAASLGPDGKTVRGDGKGRPIAERERE